MCICACVGLCVLAANDDSLGVKYLAVLVFIMSPKAMSTLCLFCLCVICVCLHVCVCMCMHLCVCPAWYQPRSYAKLPISEAQSIKTPLTTPSNEKKKHAHSQKHFSYTHTNTLYMCVTPRFLLLNVDNLRPNLFTDHGHLKTITQECTHTDKQTFTFFAFCFVGSQTSLPNR